MIAYKCAILTVINFVLIFYLCMGNIFRLHILNIKTIIKTNLNFNLHNSELNNTSIKISNNNYNK